MIAILLSILKIIGIVLLSLLLAFLVLISLVLFVPVRYRLSAEKDASVWVDGKIRWLLHIFSLHIQYKKELLIKVRLFGIVIYDSKKPKKNKKERIPKEKMKKSEAEHIAADTNAEDTLKPHIFLSEERADIPKREEIPLDSEEPKLSFFQKCRLLFQKIWEVFKNLKYTIKQIYDKIIQIIQNIEYYIDVCQREETKKAFSLCRASLIKIFNVVKPKKFRMYLHLGTNDPAATGQILVWYSMLYPFIGKNINIEPDFEQFVLEGNINTSGSIRIIVLVSVAWKLFFDKNIRKVIALFRKEEK